MPAVLVLRLPEHVGGPGGGDIVLDIILKNVNSALDLIAPMEKITYRNDKPSISLKKDTLAAMEARNKARTLGNKSKFKNLRNVVNKLVKRD